VLFLRQQNGEQKIVIWGRIIMALSKRDITNFKKELEAMKVRLTASVTDNAQEVKTPDESTGYSQHQADEGTDDFGKTISIELTAKEFDVLRQIDRALDKIEEGTYGICDITKEEISKKRLEAIPYAVMTVEAQGQREKGLV
jgi:DnaK suppressor protein